MEIILVWQIISRASNEPVYWYGGGWINEQDLEV